MNKEFPDDKKMDIVFDIDGFFLPFFSAKDKLISIDFEQQPIDNLFEQYYLGLRSTIFFCADTIKDEKDESQALKTTRDWREISKQEAWNYVKGHLSKSEQVLSPDFMWIIKEAIIDELKNEYPEVVNIQLRLSMKPRLSAKVVDENIIVFPALNRTILNHYNLAIINSIFNNTSEDGQILGEIDRSNIARLMLPYLMFCHDDFSVANLPMIYAAESRDAFMIMRQFTNLQMMFIFAHEYAHILLRHFENTQINSDNTIHIENEADNFALKVVLGYVEKNNSYSKLDVFTAIRWLFKYQLLEENVGILMRGGKLELPESKFEERRGKFQMELFENHGLSGSSLFEIRGFCTLVELQNVLYEFGAELINDIINKMNNSQKTGVIEKWWEKITNK